MTEEEPKPPVQQVRCGICGVVYSSRALPAHRPADPGDGRPAGLISCIRPESLGLVHGPGAVWQYPDE